MTDWYEYYRETCPICNNTGGCMVNSKGDTVACIRVESDVYFSKRFVSWIHRLKETRSVRPADEDHPFVEGHPKADSAELNSVYQTLLENCRLSDEHYAHLSGEQRQMTDSEIAVRNYITFPEKPWQMAKGLASILGREDFIGIPGFYENDYGWSISGNHSIMIPYRNCRNEVIGFQTRADYVDNFAQVSPGSIKGLSAKIIEQPDLVSISVDGVEIEQMRIPKGTDELIYHGSGNGMVKVKEGLRYMWLSSAKRKNGTGAGDPIPYHVARPTKELATWQSGELFETSSVWITEGALKADIAAEHIEKVYTEDELREYGTTFLAVAGTNTWSGILPVLKEMNVKLVNLAFDMDMMRNPQVANSIRDLAKTLKDEGYSANIALWNEEDGKGIDDMFINHKFAQLRKLY